MVAFNLHATIEGAELAIDGSVGSFLRLGATYAWIKTENLETGAHLPQQPANRWTVHARAEKTVWGSLKETFIGLEVRF